MFTILPSTVWIRVAHPTEQKGQMLGVVFASLIRSSCARAVAGASVAPSPNNPPMAVPAPAFAVSRKKSRRLTCIESSALWSGVGCARRLSRPLVPDDIGGRFGRRNPHFSRGSGGPSALRLASRAMLELPKLTPEHFEILVVRELRKVGLEVSELRIHRRVTSREPEEGYLLELKGVITLAIWRRRALIVCRRQEATIGRLEIESLRDHLKEADVEVGILFATASFAPDAVKAAHGSLALLRVTDGRTAFDTSGWGAPGHYP